MDTGVPVLFYRDRLDPDLIRATVLSLGAHLAVLALVVAWSALVRPQAALGPVVAYTVDLVSLDKRPDLRALGPLAPKPAAKAAPNPVVKPVVKSAPKPVVKSAPKPVVKAAPKPVAKSAPKPVVKAAPKPVAKSAPKPVVKAAPKPVAKSAPVATAAVESAAPVPAEAATGHPGGEVRGVEFVRYYEHMLDRVKSSWVWVGSADELAVTVRFSIVGDGGVEGTALLSSSGNESFDSSVLAAVAGVRFLGPPPENYLGEFSDVELTFRASELRQ